jgi:hypothetical protein
MLARADQEGGEKRRHSQEQGCAGLWRDRIGALCAAEQQGGRENA